MRLFAARHGGPSDGHDGGHCEKRPSILLGDALTNRSTKTARFALKAVALAAGCLLGTQALALGLGRLQVQSALGETLKAEIDVTSITPEEASTLRLRVASPEAYRAAGVEFNPALASAQVSLQRRPDGRSVLRLTSDRAVLEPFVDVILEASWASGRLVREYTLLFDPPGARPPVASTPAAAPAAPAAAVTAPVMSPAPMPSVPLPATPPVAAVPAPAPLPAPAAAPKPAPLPRAIAAVPATAAAGADEVRVAAGDSLSRIASRTQRPGVSLDQMLVSMFRGNPQAFVGDNMNRLKSGVVLSVPSAEKAGQVAPADARAVIQAQSADFAAYRQRLAAGAATVADNAPTRQAQGQVQANVEDKRRPANATPDKLTLSQGGLKASAPEAKISKESERKDTGTRLAELSRNVEELKRLQGATAPAVVPATPAVVVPPAAAPAAPLKAPLVNAPVPAPTAAPSPAVAPVASPAVPPPAEPVASAKPPAPAPVPAPKPAEPKPAAAEPGFLASLLENPLVLPGAGVLVALLAGLGLYRLRGRGRKQAGETSFLESRLQPDSFFGASGGQRIDTREAGGATPSSTSSSSMSYSLSQLDAIGDVDPVAEADVYLAYGRDLQAEEILKEAMRATPDRMAIRTKLLEVYAKRRDTKGFELLATQVYSLTGGAGEDWAKAQEMGLQIDAENRLYQPGGHPDLAVDESGRMVEPLNATTRPYTATPLTPQFVPASDATLAGGLDVDLDLDLAGDVPLSPAEVTRPLQTGADIGEAADSLSFDLPDVAPLDEAPTSPGALSIQPPAGMANVGLDFDLDELPTEPQLPVATTVTDIDPGLDFGDFGVADSGAPQSAFDDSDPLARKLELAEEFRQIGDVEGARDLLEEVIAKAEGALKSKAQGMLDGLG